MRGHLQARGDSWRIKVYVGRSADGTKRYVERTIHGDGLRPSGSWPAWWSRSTRAATPRPRR